MRIVIIGAGPTGLGTAWRLAELGYTDWVVYEKDNHPGGMSSSHADDNGFTWDEGGHVLFSRYEYFDRVIEEVLRGEYLEHERHTWIYVLGTWVPYPFQNNLRHLPKNILEECVEGLRAAQASGGARTTNLETWLLMNFGAGICKYFLFPHNRKLWTIPLTDLGAYWVESSVSPVDVAQVLKDVSDRRDQVDFGTNRLFKYPLTGGTGRLWQQVAAQLPDHIRFGTEVTGVNLTLKRVELSDGNCDGYDILLNTMPLDNLVGRIIPTDAKRTKAAAHLVHNNVLVVGIGLKEATREDKSWVYFPEPGTPFYRVTYLSNYSPQNVPGGRPEEYSSFMCETAYSPKDQINKEEVFNGCLKALRSAGILASNDERLIVSRYLRPVEYAYPVPTLDRNTALATIETSLEPQQVYSRGRLGSWRYESGSMDQCFMQGVDFADGIAAGGLTS